jgi:hypothetical protein
MNQSLYFEEDTKWTPDKGKAKRFATKEEGIKQSDRAGLYTLIIEEV